MRKYKAVIFDFDGTLCNTLPDICAAGNHALAALSFPTHALDDYKYFVGEGVLNLCRNLLPEEARDHDTVERLRLIYKKYYTQHSYDLTQPYEGVKELVAKLKEKGIPIAVLSNKDNADTIFLTEHFFGKGAFDVVLGARKGYPVKPNPQVPFEIAGKLKTHPSDTLFVGDSMFDIITAVNARMGSCGVLWGFRDKKELKAAGASIIIETPDELLKHIV